jgi:hypothetical protein
MEQSFRCAGCRGKPPLCQRTDCARRLNDAKLRERQFAHANPDLHPRYTEDSQAHWKAAGALGWQIKRLTSWRVPDHFRQLSNPDQTGAQAVGCGVYTLDHMAPGEVTQAAANAVLQDGNQETVLAQAQEVLRRIPLAIEFSNKGRDGVQVVGLNPFQTKRHRMAPLLSVPTTRGSA